MKARRSLFVALFLFLVCGNAVHAQLEELMEAAQQLSEMENEQNPQNNQGQDPNQGEGGLTPEQEQWQQEWEEEMEENRELLNSLDTEYLKCTALMVLYVHAYLKLVNEHKIGDLGMSACDAYGMQVLAMATSTTIMYCPEGMSQLSEEELKVIGDDFGNAINQFTQINDNPWVSDEYHPLLVKLKYIIRNFFNGVQAQDAGDMTVYDGSPDTPVHVIKYMIEFFRPRYIIPQTLQTAREMEAMGCNG